MTPNNIMQKMEEVPEHIIMAWLLSTSNDFQEFLRENESVISIVKSDQVRRFGEQHEAYVVREKGEWVAVTPEFTTEGFTNYDEAFSYVMGYVFMKEHPEHGI